MLLNRTASMFIMITLAGQLLSGCAWLKRAIEGTETLEEQPVTGLQVATADGSQEICAGARVQLRVQADIEGKQPLTTWTYGPDGEPVKKGHLNFDEFSFSANFGQVDGETGFLVVPNTGPALLGQRVEVQVASEHAQGHTARFELAVHFGCGAVLDFSGAPGVPGQQGPAGQSGRDGKSESSSGSYARPGGHGEDGTDGGHGGRGGHGDHGHSLLVDIAKIEHDGTQLVLVRVTDQNAGNQTRSVIVDPARGGKVAVHAHGGSGGAGGNGGVGGRGGHGGTGAPAGDSGNGGSGGDGGDGGDGGNGGTVVVRYDTNHPDLAGLIEVGNRAGAAGGAGGAGSYGSAPAAFSGARAGRSGQMGRQGHPGRPGSDGPPVQAHAVPLQQMFPDAGGLNFL